MHVYETTSSLSAMQRSYAIIGTGAVGGLYGAQLQRAGLDVHFLLRSDYEHVRQHGLLVESKTGNFALPKVQAYRDVHDMPRCDVVVVALKTTQNHLLPQLLPPHIKDTGVVLVMQNGLGNEDEFAAIAGPARVMGALCFLGSYKVGPGHIQHLEYGLVRLGEHSVDGKPRGVTDRMCRIAGDFQRAGVATQFAEDLITARWEKLVWNIPFNGLSVLLDASTDQLMRDQHSRALIEQIMREVVADAGACGRRIAPEFVQHLLDITTKLRPYHTSMKLDHDAGRPMEVEAIFGNPLRAARQAGANAPLLEALYAELKFLDARNLKGVLPKSRRGARQKKFVPIAF
jgi:2-dehydropantoate 2-reductase